MYQPLADLLRPQTLDDVFGQEHILGKGAILRRLIDSGKIPNMIFYGPSGTGKTTVANIIAKQTNRTLYKLNATTASTADIKEIVAQLDTFMAPNGVLLYLDEIQSFNKKQQQSLLEHIENGKITLIASTTENPYFYVFNAILSRSTIFEFKQIDAPAALQAVQRAVKFMEDRTALTAVVEEGALEYIAGACGGDIRKAMNAVEVLFSAGMTCTGIVVGNSIHTVFHAKNQINGTNALLMAQCKKGIHTAIQNRLIIAIKEFCGVIIAAFICDQSSSGNFCGHWSICVFFRTGSGNRNNSQ